MAAFGEGGRLLPVEGGSLLLPLGAPMPSSFSPWAHVNDVDKHLHPPPPPPTHTAPSLFPPTRYLGAASIKDIYHERAWLETSISLVRVKIVVEVSDRAHGKALLQTLWAAGYTIENISMPYNKEVLRPEGAGGLPQQGAPVPLPVDVLGSGGVAAK
jgi:hypothetical protein